MKLTTLKGGKILTKVNVIKIIPLLLHHKGSTEKALKLHKLLGCHAIKAQVRLTLEGILPDFIKGIINVATTPWEGIGRNTVKGGAKKQEAVTFAKLGMLGGTP